MDIPIEITFDSDKPKQRRMPPRLANRLKEKQTDIPPAPAPKPQEETKSAPSNGTNELWL